jgi:hypothetical protein
MAGDDLRAIEQAPEVGAGCLLAGLGPEGEQVGGECAVGAEQRLDRHRRGDVGDAEQRPEVGAGEDEHPEDPVGAVDQRQALLGGQPQRLQSGRGERLGAPEAAPVGGLRLALADEDEGAVGERGEIAAGAERAVLGDDRGDPGVEQGDDLLGDQGPGARVAHRQRPRPQQHHRADDLALDRRSHAGRMRAQQRELELLAGGDRDRRRRQRAEPGRDTVGRLAARLDPGDDRGRPLHRLDRIGPEPDGGARAGDGDDLSRLHAAGAEDDLRLSLRARRHRPEHRSNGPLPARAQPTR